MGFCSGIDPISLKAYCAAVQFRFASSAREYLFELRDKVIGMIQDDLPLSPPAIRGLPFGNMDSPPILCSLLDSLEFIGPMSSVPNICANNPEHNWILTYPISACPLSSGLQAAVLRVLMVKERTSDLPTSIARKATVTLGQETANSLMMAPLWFESLSKVLDLCPIYVRMCWLKSVAGAWCTSTRLNKAVRLPCIFGCVDSMDNIRHYLICPVLWQFARETLHVYEEHIDIGHRLCLRVPSINKMRLLTFCFSLYHAITHDDGCISATPRRTHPDGCTSAEGVLQCPRVIQSRAVALARSVKHFVAMSNFQVVHTTSASDVT